jgi:hypothetical protein
MASFKKFCQEKALREFWELHNKGLISFDAYLFFNKCNSEEIKFNEQVGVLSPFKIFKFHLN